MVRKNHFGRLRSEVRRSRSNEVSRLSKKHKMPKSKVRKMLYG